MDGECGEAISNRQDHNMLAAIITTLIITFALGYGLGGGRGRRGAIIVARPYNNRYNDASGAREDSYR
jgi:hypothetical protein